MSLYGYIKKYSNALYLGLPSYKRLRRIAAVRSGQFKDRRKVSHSLRFSAWRRQKPIARETVLHRRQRLIYVRQARAFVKGKPCAVFRMQRANQNHHQRGRLGPLLMDKRFWIPVSGKGHRWINANPQLAREQIAFLTDGRHLTLLCEVGEWNTPPK